MGEAPRGPIGLRRSAGREGDAASRAVVSVAAPAKVNLYLHVTGRRADGYHEIDSLVAFVDIHDRVRVGPGPELRLEVSGPFAHVVPGGADNLVWRAAAWLRETAGVTLGACISLIKSLPVAAGLGGGSADAAAVIRALTALWRVADETPDPLGLAASLGADVPVCLFGRPALVSGIGDRLVPAPVLPACQLVLANPGVPVSTREVYRGLSEPVSSPAPFVAALGDARDLAALLHDRRNDLTEPALRLAPVVGAVLARLESLDGCLIARMSGSGPTCFALFAEADAAAAAAADLARERPEWWVAHGRLLGLEAPSVS